jgi:hypothetical protein
MIKQKISDHPVLMGIERIVEIVGFMLNSDLKIIDFFYRINYEKEGQDMSDLISPRVPDWRMDNSINILARDQNFNPIENPDFIEEKDEEGNVMNEENRFIKIPAFDYTSGLMLESTAQLRVIMSLYITERDNDGLFNI